VTGSLTISTGGNVSAPTIFGSTIACSPIGCFATSCATSFIGGTMSGTTIYGSTAVCSAVGLFSDNVGLGATSSYAKFNISTGDDNQMALGTTSVGQTVGIYLADGPTTSSVGYKWEFGKTTANNFFIYSYCIAANALTIASTGAATFTCQVNAESFYTNDTRYISNQIMSGYNTNSEDSDIWINYTGYLGGTTRFRDFRIGNGKQGQIALFDGSTGAATFACSVTVTSGYIYGVCSNSFIRIDNSIGGQIGYINTSFIADGDGLKLTTAGTERMRITTGGITCFACQVCAPRLILNRCNAVSVLNVNNEDSTDDAGVRGLAISTDRLRFGVSPTTSTYGAIATNGTNSGITFITYDNAWTEKMRIACNGEVLVNTTSTGAGYAAITRIGSYQGYTSDSNTTTLSTQRTAGFFGIDGGASSNNQGSYTAITANVAWGASNNPGSIFRGYQGTTLSVQICYNGNLTNTNGSYGTISSDRRLKENIVSATSKLDDLMKLSVVNFNLIGNEEKHIGFIAQDMQEVFPSFVYQSDTRKYDENGNFISGFEDTLGLKVGMEFAILTKAIQEQQCTICSQASRITLLESCLGIA